MQRALHTLKLVLGSQPKFNNHMKAANPTQQFVWPCECSASGLDEAALVVECCKEHLDLLAVASSSRAMREG
jgi:hypothetical protein